MDIDAERDALIKLLQRALRSVPFVKLDAVEDVMALFESGLNLLEANLIDICDLPTSTTTSSHSHSHPFSSADSLSSSLLPSLSSSSSNEEASSGRRSGLSLNVPSGQPFRDPLVSPGGTESAASLILRDDHDDVEARANSNHQSINAAVAAAQAIQPAAGKALDESAIKTVANRALLGVTVTRDYSSPRSSARSLSVSSASTNGPPSAAAAAAALQATAQQATHKKLGLGLKSAAERDKPVAPPAASGAPPAEVPPVQQQPARGMSSRATSMTSNVGPGLRGKLGLGSASSSASSSSSSAPSTTSSSSSGTPATASSGTSTPDDEAPNKVAKPLPKHVLNRISGSSKEFPSPKLGGRSLGGLAGASSSSSSSSSAANSLTRSTRSPANTSDDFEVPTKPDADDSIMGTDEDKLMTSTASGSMEGEDDEPVSSGISSSTEGQSDDTEAGDEEMSSCSSSAGEDDLLLKPRSKGPLAKIRDNVALPVTASPKQFRSSLALVALAANSANSNGSAVNPDTDLVGPADPTTKPSFSSSAPSSSFDAVSAASAHSHASILRENLSASSSFSNSPKPAFLRRLDSPNTQYSKLMQAKIKLQSIINKAISEAPRMKASSATEIRSAFEKAVNKLESSTTVTQANTDLKPLPL